MCGVWKFCFMFFWRITVSTVKQIVNRQFWICKVNIFSIFILWKHKSFCHHDNKWKSTLCTCDFLFVINFRRIHKCDNDVWNRCADEIPLEVNFLFFPSSQIILICVDIFRVVFRTQIYLKLSSRSTDNVMWSLFL